MQQFNTLKAKEVRLFKCFLTTIRMSAAAHVITQ